MGWRHDIWKKKRRVTHPSVSWKLTFTFFADPRSSERQKREHEWIFAALKYDSKSPSVPCYEQYLTFMIATISCSRGTVRFIHSSSQLKQHFPPLTHFHQTEAKISLWVKLPSHFLARCLHERVPLLRVPPPMVTAPYVSVILNIYAIQSMLAVC